MAPSLIQHPLDRADGSSVFSDGLYAVLAAVNGPIEVQRRDELPEEAAIEINLRPSSGVGGPRERWLEMVVQSAIKPVLLANMHPRSLVQVTLQVTKEPALKIPKTVAAVSIIPALVNAAFLALADGGLPLASTATAALLVVSDDGSIESQPSEKRLLTCRSIHAVAFNQYGEQLLDESSGRFEVSTWNTVVDLGQEACLSAITAADGDAAMSNAGDETRAWLRDALEEQAKSANSWRQAT